MGLNRVGGGLEPEDAPGGAIGGGLREPVAWLGAADLRPVRVHREFEIAPGYTLVHGEALRALYRLPARSIDLCLTDVPYGTTGAAWDSPIPFPEMWAALDRVMKPGAPVLLFAAQPFASALVASNLREWRDTWYWIKNRVTNVANARRQPLRCVEHVEVFRGADAFFPVGLTRVDRIVKQSRNAGGKAYRSGSSYGVASLAGDGEYTQEFTGYPRNVLRFPLSFHERGFHPNRKPVALNRYLIESYSRRGGRVLDFTCGSGSSGEAAAACAREWIGIERDPEHAQTTVDRVGAAARAARLAVVK